MVDRKLLSHEIQADATALPGPSASGTSYGTFRRRQLSWTSWQDMKVHLLQDVDPALSTTPLTMLCFMTGYLDAVTVTAIYIWCAFQTGNTIQLSLALARLVSPETLDFSFRISDRQALVSLLAFLGGAFIGRIGDKIGSNKRLWLILGTLIQALFSMGAALSVWKSGQASIAGSRGEPAWTTTRGFLALGFASASMGLQGIMGKRMNSQFATTVVLTSVWCELMADPKLFTRGWVRTRDHKVLAVFALFLGGFVGRSLVGQIGSAGTFGIGTAVRLLIALSWLIVPGKPDAK